MTHGGQPVDGCRHAMCGKAEDSLAVIWTRIDVLRLQAGSQLLPAEQIEGRASSPSRVPPLFVSAYRPNCERPVSSDCVSSSGRVLCNSA